jgi:hypothetical protein
MLLPAQYYKDSLCVHHVHEEVKASSFLEIMRRSPMPENTNFRIMHANVYACVEYNTHIEIEVSEHATEEEIQQELDDAAQLAVEENLQTYQGLQPEITITRLDEEEEKEKKLENGLVYRYQVNVSTHQMLHQTIEIVSEYPLSDEQIAQQAVEKAQKGVWTPGDIDQSIDIDTVIENG